MLVKWENFRFNTCPLNNEYPKGIPVFTRVDPPGLYRLHYVAYVLDLITITTF